jgi:CheY-like chemotaxis protein
MSKTILVVEPDPLVREINQTGLTRVGFLVIATDEPTSALQIIQRATPPIDLVVTAFVFPTMTGLQLASAIRDAHPALPVIALSGDPLRHLKSPADSKVFAMVLTKPCILEVLAASIRRCLR